MKPRRQLHKNEILKLKEDIFKSSVSTDTVMDLLTRDYLATIDDVDLKNLHSVKKDKLELKEIYINVNQLNKLSIPSDLNFRNYLCIFKGPNTLSLNNVGKVLEKIQETKSPDIDSDCITGFTIDDSLNDNEIILYLIY